MNLGSKFFDILLPLATSIVTGILVDIIGNKLYAGEQWNTVFTRLRWWNILVVLWFVLIILSIYRYSRIRNQVEEVKLDLYINFQNIVVFVIRQLFKILAEASVYPKKNANLNIHIFFREIINDKEVLVKDRRYFFEQERLSRNYPLDYVIPSEDDLVICHSFNSQQVKYEELPPTHMERYNERIKEKIDPDIKWVLSCPLHVPGEKPLGVICSFGGKIFFKSEQQRKYFESMLQSLSEVIVKLKMFERKISSSEVKNELVREFDEFNR